jgi:23S rRNA pseudouridine1911/1915/1917 synthase
VEGEVLRRQVDTAGKRAVTHYRTEAVGGGLALLRLHLDTGRTHQIRVHMAHRGHPLAGDFLYGEEGSAGMTRTALHAARLTLRQPITGELLVFEAPLPEDMAALAAEMEEIPCASW